MARLGTLHTREDGRLELRFERRFAHPVERVWRPITEAEQLAVWLPAYVEIDPTPDTRRPAALRLPFRGP